VEPGIQGGTVRSNHNKFLIAGAFFCALAALAHRISGIFLLRGVTFVGLMPAFPENSLTFWLVSSAICLVIGGLFAVGTYQQWPKPGGQT